MKVKKNDTVLVITGKDAGKTAKVLTALPKENRVIVDGVNDDAVEAVKAVDGVVAVRAI